MEDFLVADMIYCTKTIPKPLGFDDFCQNSTPLGYAAPHLGKDFLSQDDYLCEVSLWSHWVHLGLAQACGNEKLRRINYPKEQRNMENTENRENCAYTVD